MGFSSSVFRWMRACFHDSSSCRRKHLILSLSHTHARVHPHTPPPQRPYCTLGSLRDQLHYPQKPGASEHRSANESAELLAILEAVNLGALPERCVI